jgi:TPR repeat protein
MGRRDEPKMDELKKLLRRLDGLDGDKSLVKKTQEEDQRGYVGALRGAPMSDDGDMPSLPQPEKAKASSGAAVYMAAATAALISTVTVFFIMTWQGKIGPERAGQKRLEMNQPAANGAGPGIRQQQSTDTANALVRRADVLLQSGEIEAARALLQRAAELGSGSAAFKLGLTYDPSQTRSVTFADSQSNPALAKAWYERALALGTQEAASYLSNPDRK